MEYSDVSKENHKRVSFITAIGLLLMAIFAPIAQMGIFPKLFLLENPLQTLNMVKSFEILLRIGIVCFLFVGILDIIVAWGLFIIYKPTDKNLAILSAWLRIIYAAILISLLNNLMNIISLINVQNMNSEQIILSYKSFQDGWNIGLLVFGFHLIVLGIVMLKSKYTPKIISIMIWITALGYIIDSIGKILFKNYNIEITLFTFIGEVVLIVWLFIKGIKGYNSKI